MIELASGIVRAAVATIFLVSGVAKFVDMQGTAHAIVGLGIPPAISRWAARIIPALEVAIAITLIPESSAAYSAAAAVGLLATFSWLIAFNLFRGRHPRCNCFGFLSSKPLRRSDLVRNSLLVFGAAYVVWREWPGSAQSATIFVQSVDVPDLFQTVMLALAVVIASQSTFISHLLVENHRNAMRLTDPENYQEATGQMHLHLPLMTPVSLPAIGEQAPGFAALDGNDESRTLRGLLHRGLHLLLVFTASNCYACHEMIPEISRWQRVHETKMTLVVVSVGIPRRWRSEGLLTSLLLQDGSAHEIHRMYGVNYTPSGIAIDANGIVSSALVVGSAAIRALVATTAGSPFMTARPISSDD